MALIAMTTADAVDYVSDLDPAKTQEGSSCRRQPTRRRGSRTSSLAEGATTFKLRSLDVFLMGTSTTTPRMLRGARAPRKSASTPA